MGVVGVEVGGWRWLGFSPHMCTCMCGKHDNFMQMVTPLGESLGIPYDVIHMCACICMHMCGDTLSPPLPYKPTLTPAGDPRISKNSIALDVWVYSLVGGWVGGWGQVKSLKIFKNVD